MVGEAFHIFLVLPVVCSGEADVVVLGVLRRRSEREAA